MLRVEGMTGWEKVGNYGNFSRRPSDLGVCTKPAVPIFLVVNSPKQAKKNNGEVIIE